MDNVLNFERRRGDVMRLEERLQERYFEGQENGSRKKEYELILKFLSKGRLIEDILDDFDMSMEDFIALQKEFK